MPANLSHSVSVGAPYGCEVVNATYGFEGVEDEPVYLRLRSAQPDNGSESNDVFEPIIALTAMPFNTWQVVKRRIKERWPGLKAVPDANIRLLHKSVELRNNRMVEDYNLEGGSVDRPIELQYLIIDQADNSSHKGERNIGLYVDAQAPCSPTMRERVAAAIAALLSGIHPRLTEEGTGATYLLRDSANRRTLAVFKPKDEEAFAPQNPRGYVGRENSVGLRQGILSTQQATREVAAYVLDHDNFVGVPETTLVHGKHPKFVQVKGKAVWKIGAFQAFVETKDTAGNFAPQIFPVQDVHRIGILDVRIVNLDRNDGNLLVRRTKTGHSLVPIDHGLSLPDRLEVFTDDIAWMAWPQARQPFGEAELAYIKSLNGPRDARLLAKCLGIRRECLRLLEVTTQLLQIGAEKGLTLYEIGTLLYREDRGSEEPASVHQSKLEQMISGCVDAALAAVGDGPAVSSMLSGLDLQTSKPACRQVMTLARQTSQGEKSSQFTPMLCPSSPFSSPLSTVTTGNAEKEIPQLSLDGLSDSDTPGSPINQLQGQGHASKGDVQTGAADKAEASARQTPRPFRGSFRAGTARLRQRPSAALVASHREDVGGDPQASIFARPGISPSAWLPEMEKAFRRHLALELSEYMRQHYPASRRSSTDREESARSEKCKSPVDTSLASALPLRHDDESDDQDTLASLASRSANRNVYIPPQRRTCSATQDEQETDKTADKATCAVPAASSSGKPKYIPPALRRQQAEAEKAGKAVPVQSAQPSSGPRPGLHSDEKGGDQRCGYCMFQGARANMEDALDAISSLDSATPTEFYAVFDGHGGTHAVEFVKSKLPSYLCSQEGFRECSRLPDALTNAFRQVDAELLTVLRDNPRTDPPKEMELSSGCVGCIALIRGSQIHIANLGDCRAILCSEGEFTQITVDHGAGPDGNEAEKCRLAELGVEVSGDGYLHGRIGVSRAFGDWVWSCEEKCRGLICQPEIFTAEVTEGTEFLLLACDGIFEKMTSKEAGQIVRRRLRSTGNAQSAAESLVEFATKQDVSDNLSAIVVLFKTPPQEQRAAPRRTFGGFKLNMDQ